MCPHVQTVLRTTDPVEHVPGKELSVISMDSVRRRVECKKEERRERVRTRRMAAGIGYRWSYGLPRRWTFRIPFSITRIEPMDLILYYVCN